MAASIFIALCTRAIARNAATAVSALVAASMIFGLAHPPASAATQLPCPAGASVAVFANNLSAEPSVEVVLEGELRDPALTCEGTGQQSYAVTLTCAGSGLVRCGAIRGLRPGAWVNRIATHVANSQPQRQAQRTVFVGGAGAEVSNVITWIIHPRTFVVGAASEIDLRAQLDAAAEHTQTNPGPALVTFSPETFPGADAPQTIELSKRRCAADNMNAGLCLTGSHIVVDALDVRGERGGVILSVARQPLKLLRIYSADNILRGLVLRGSEDTAATQTDTVSIVGGTARRNRLEQCVVHGPGNGDAISIEDGAGLPSGSNAGDNVIDDCEIMGASRAGLKVTTGARATIQRSCVHDNRNGGIVSTLGGHVIALDNLVQRNAPGGAQHGLHVETSESGAQRSTLVTDGNIVRFNGARGLSVGDRADAAFANDYVADNQYAGVRVETTLDGGTPTASFNGVSLACNRNGGISGTCQPASAGVEIFCTTDADCCAAGIGCCAGAPDCPTPVRCATAAPQGFGVVVSQC